MRGTFKGIEVERRGGEQAHRRVGSLKLLQDLHNTQSALRPAPLRFFCDLSCKIPHSRILYKWRVVFMRPIRRRSLSVGSLRVLGG